MTGESHSKSTEQHGDNRLQAMDAEKNDTASARAAAGPSTTGGAATQEHSIPTPMTVDHSERSEEQKGGQGKALDRPSESAGPRIVKQVTISEPSSQTQTTPESFKSVMASVEYKDGARDPFSVIGTEDVEPQKPHPSQHLMAMYGLSPLAASVARFDPITGEKINRLRKSYEGQVTKLGLSGRNKAVKHEPDPEGRRLGLEELVRYPHEEWKIQHEMKTPLKKGWNNSGNWDVAPIFKEKLERAFRFESLPVPKALNQDWEYILGHEKPRAKTSKPTAGNATPATAPSKANGVSHAGISAAGGIVRSSTPVNAGEAARPRRAGKKRRYNDDSFEGYGEGFVDDDAGTDGADSSNEGSKSGRKKRRKDSTAAPMPPRPQGRMASYGPGMIHQNGIGAFR